MTRESETLPVPPRVWVLVAGICSACGDGLGHGSEAGDVGTEDEGASTRTTDGPTAATDGTGTSAAGTAVTTGGSGDIGSGTGTTDTGDVVEGQFEVVPSGVTVTLRGVRFADETTAWAVGDHGTMLASTTVGADWTIAPAVSDGILRSITFVDRSTGWAVGDGDSQAPPASGHILHGSPLRSGTVLETLDGETWAKGWFTRANFELRCVRMASATVGQLCDYANDYHRDGDLVVTHDGGQSWSLERAYRGLNDAFWLDETTAWAVGSRVSLQFGDPPSDLLTNETARIIGTEDGGKNWLTQEAPDLDDSSHQLFGVWFVDAETGVAVGDGGTIQRTTDAGASWENIPSGVTTSLRSVVFLAAGQGFVVGTEGSILETRDGGASWTSVGSPTASDLFEVHALPGSSPVAVGAEGIIVRLQ